MGFDVTVIVATFGSPDWVQLAHQRAIPSALAEGAPVIHRHAGTLAAARNSALQEVTTEWVVFLDADDELEPGYLAALATGSADVRAPAVRYLLAGRARPPCVPRVAGHRHACTADCLEQGNWLVIGSAMRAEQARAIGGFREWPVYEDWCLFLRLRRAGATFEAIPAAVYRAHVRPGSRNRAPSIQTKNQVHQEILAAA